MDIDEYVKVLESRIISLEGHKDTIWNSLIKAENQCNKVELENVDLKKRVKDLEETCEGLAAEIGHLMDLLEDNVK